MHLESYFPLIGAISYIFIFVCGLILGSFLNAWIWRTRENIRVVSGFSMCVHCRRMLVWYEKIPLFSFIVLRGKCRTCKKLIPASYFWTELLTAVALTMVFYYHVNINTMFSEWWMMRDVFFLTCLVVIFVYDWKYQLVLSRIVWPGVLIGLAINHWALNYKLSDLLLGMVIGGGFFLIQYLISHGRWIGGGDIRLGLMMGAWLGWQLTILALFLAYILGAIYAIILLLGKKATRNTEIPFGIFLALSTFFTLYNGRELVEWYLGLLR